MIFVENYKALVVKEVRNIGIFIYVSIGYDSWGKPQFHHTRQPLLHPSFTTIDDILEPFRKEADQDFISRFYEEHVLVDVQLFMKDPEG